MMIKKSTLLLLLSIFLLQPATNAKDRTGDGEKDSLSYHEFDYRMQMALERLTGNKIIPEYTEQFILADVNLDPSYIRRFNNFSGDLSGRYLEVMSMVNKKNVKINLPGLVKKIISFQKKDGRFGSDSLIFNKDRIGGEHMALLWGNGRMLVGLMQYYKEYKDEDALKAALRLGDFFISCYTVCSDPEVSKRLEGFRAMGIICFTQYIEGLVLLSEYSHDPKYAQIAARTYKVLPPRGKQHTHGYLSTLRGVLMLYNYDHKKEHLDFVKSKYDDLVQSEDYTPFGSVREYFGHMKEDRDEGCSTADFMRLSFDLYKITGNKTYLDKGEFSLLNALYFNQYYTGDFGAHVLIPEGSGSDFLQASWWCCTMHGLRAMYEVRKNYLAEETASGIKINLYVETAYHGHNIEYAMVKDKVENGLHWYNIKINTVKPNSGPLALRIPGWVEKAVIWVNGKKVNTTPKQGYISIDKFVAGDVIRIGFVYKTNIYTADGNVVGLAQLTEVPVVGYLHYGPYLLGVDDKLDPTFTAEPNRNTIYMKHAKPAANSYYSMRYQHDGFPSDLPGKLRPVSTLTFDKHGYLMIRLSFASEKVKTGILD